MHFCFLSFLSLVLQESNCATDCSTAARLAVLSKMDSKEIISEKPVTGLASPTAVHSPASHSSSADEKPEVSTAEEVPQDHNDILHHYDRSLAPQYTKKEEDAVIRKLDWHLMPLIFVLYSLSVLDRSNLGNARISGMEDDIDLSGKRYDWLGTTFYIACMHALYITCCPPVHEANFLPQTFSLNGLKWDGKPSHPTLG